MGVSGLPPPLSPDGMWWWDGWHWQPTELYPGDPAGTVPRSRRSAGGRWRGAKSVEVVHPPHRENVAAALTHLSGME